MKVVTDLLSSAVEKEAPRHAVPKLVIGALAAYGAELAVSSLYDKLIKEGRLVRLIKRNKA